MLFRSRFRGKKSVFLALLTFSFSQSQWHLGWIPGTPPDSSWERFKSLCFAKSNFWNLLCETCFEIFFETFTRQGELKGALRLSWGAKHPMASDHDFSGHLRASDGSTKAGAPGGCAVLARESPGARFDNQDFSVQPRGPPRSTVAVRRKQGNGSSQ